MKTLLFLLITATTFSETFAQLNCNQEITCRVIAPSGMRMRSKPSLKATVAGSVPYDSLVTACRETFGSMTYEDQNGFWRKVSYQGKVGYMFDGFLEIIAAEGQTANKYEKLSELDTTAEGQTQTTAVPAGEATIARTTASRKFDFITEAYNYCGDVNTIDPTLLWYGFYPQDPRKGSNIRVKQVDLKVVLSKTKVGQGMEFDIETGEQERSIFLLGLNRPLDTQAVTIPDHSEQLQMGGRKIFPGQEMVLSEGGSPIKLSATGTVSSSGPCPDLKDYKLMLTGEKYGLNIEQNLGNEVFQKGQCGMPEVYWYGDFTGDGIPEIVFVSVYDEKNHFTLFISDPRQDHILLTKQSEWVIDRCY